MVRPIDASNPLVLGSGSPRRREILTSLLIAHVVRKAEADETVRPNETPAAYMARVALAKLDAVRAIAVNEPDSESGEAATILVADTSVIDGGAILGKPESLAHGEQLIAQLAGKTHEVHTRFALASASAHAAGPLHAETVITRVTFRPLSARDVKAYAANGEGRDKAGGYAVQGLGASLVARIDGSYTNVVGLPACELVVALSRLGLVP